jgi:hypothetical protein
VNRHSNHERRLDEHAERSVDLRARQRGDSLGHLFLHHEDDTVDVLRLLDGEA